MLIEKKKRTPKRKSLWNSVIYYSITQLGCRTSIIFVPKERHNYSRPPSSWELIAQIFHAYVVPVLFGFSTIKKKAFKTVSQTQINHRESEFSKGTAGKVFSGERLSWIETANSDNFKTLQSFDWQIHIYGQASKELIEFVQSQPLAVYEFS